MDRKRPPAHGTRRRYRHHIRNNQVPCGPCARANAEAEYRRRNKGRRPMDRNQLEALIWRHWPTTGVRGSQAARAVATILDAADAYARSRQRWQPRKPLSRRLYHTSGTDLHPVIRVLAEALLEDEQEVAA